MADRSSPDGARSLDPRPGEPAPSPEASVAHPQSEPPRGQQIPVPQPSIQEPSIQQAPIQQASIQEASIKQASIQQAPAPERPAAPAPGLVRLLHSADWQIGKPFKAVADPQKRFRLQEERLRAIGRIDLAARRHGASLVVVAGDLFDSRTVALSTALEVLEAIGAMAVPVLVIPGNHDHGGPGGLWENPDWQRHRQERAPNLQLLLERQPLELEQLLVLPCPLLRQHDASDPTGWIRGLDWASLPAAKPRLVIAHGGVQGFSAKDYGAAGSWRSAAAAAGPGTGSDRNRALAPDGAINRIDLAQLPQGELDYIALGDWHNLKQVSSKAWYSGTPEPDRHDQGEANQRGQVLRVDIGRGQPPQVQVLPTGRLGWHNLALHLAGDADLEQLETRIRERTAGRVNQDLLRLEITGSLSLAAHRRYTALLADLETQLLDLRLRGGCDQAPQAGELAALTERPDDPLIARVAQELQARLAREEQSDAQAAAISRAALCELFRLASSA